MSAHPSARESWAYSDEFGKAIRAGFSQADARDMAEQAARRVRRACWRCGRPVEERGPHECGLRGSGPFNTDEDE